MRVLLFILISVVLSNIGWAQMQQPDRYEIELGTFDDSYDVLSGNENGILLYKPLELYRSGNQLWQFIMLDTTLNQVWKKEYFIDRELEFRGYDHFGLNFYFLFQNTRTSIRNLLLVQMDIATGDTLQHTIKNLVPLHLTEFEVTEGAALIGGYYNIDPVVIYFDFRLHKTKVLPGIFGSRTELIQVKINEDNGISVLVSARTIDKRNTLALKTYDQEGNYIESYIFEPQVDNGLIFGRVAALDGMKTLVSGTYGGRRSEYSRGLFIASHDVDQGQRVAYYNYADFNNFFNYMRARQQDRVANRISRKKIKGKDIKFHYRVLVHEIIPDGDNYVMLGEAFYPKYSNSASLTGYNSYSGYFGGSNYIASGFNGYRYTHAVVIGFDRKGKMLWDNSFEIEDVVTYSLNQYVHADITDQGIVLLYLYNDEIRSKIIKGSDVIEGKSFDNVKLTFADDVVRKNNMVNIGGLEKWYSDRFFAYGVQHIKNLKDSGVKLNRKVFYVNKIIYSTDDQGVSLSNSN